MSHRVPAPLPRVAVAVAASLLLGPLAAAQGYVERAAAVGLLHDFATGLDRIGEFEPMSDWSQQGIGLGDLDGDGDLDVVAVARMRPNHVFRNDGGTFADVSAVAAIDTAAFDGCVALGDHDRDGDLDLFVGSLEHGQGVAQGRSRLYANDGGFAMRDVTALSRTYGNGRTIAAAWVDLDRDGWLDLYTSEFNGTPNAFYRNEGDGSFTETAAALGLATGGSVHVAAFFDADGDGLYDVIPGTDWRVSNAANLFSNTDDVFLHGQADGTWADVTAGSGIDKSGPPNFGSATMGIAVGDVDYDGDLDMYQTQVDVQFLLLNQGWPATGLPWLQAQDGYGVANAITAAPAGAGSTVGWGCVLFHADADPWLDLFKVNGHVSAANPRDQQNYLFRGLGPAAGFAFADETAAYGLQHYYDARGMASGDLDGDGDVDLLTAPVAGALRYYENQIDPAGQGRVAVRPVSTTSAPGGFGVVVSWTDSLGYPHVTQLGADGVTAGQSEYVARFGIGTEASVDLDVRFPSGVTLSFPGTAPDTLVEAVEPLLIEAPAVLPTADDAPGTTGSAGGTWGGTAPVTRVAAPYARPFAVFVNAHDATGAPLGPAADVQIEIPGLAPATPVRHVGGNRFERRFLHAEEPGRHAVEVTIDGWAVGVRPTVAFRGPADPAQTGVTLEPEAVRAGSTDTYRVLVVPRDAGGRLVGRGRDVSVLVPGVAAAAALADHGDGSYSAAFAAPSTAGTFAVQALVDGAPAVTSPQLEVGSFAFGSTSLYYAEKPNPKFAMMPNQMKVLVTPRDLFGRRLGPGASVAVTIQPNPGTQPVTLVPGVVDPARPNGEHTFVFERPAGTSPNSAKGTFSFSVDGGAPFTKSYEF